MSKVLICPECKSEIESETKVGEKTILFDGKCPYCGKTIGHSIPPGNGGLGTGGRGVLPKSKEQLGILVLDGSGSMVTKTKELIKKYEAVSNSVTEFFYRMKDSRRKNAFSFAVVYFDEEAFRRMDITATKDIDLDADYSPVRKDGQGTYLCTGLKEAEKIADAFLNGKEKSVRSVIIIIMTDGIDMDKTEAIKVADQIKAKYGEKVKISASSFGTMDLKEKDREEIMEFLRTIVTDQKYCLETASSEELRGFFINSVSQGKPL